MSTIVGDLSVRLSLNSASFQQGMAAAATRLRDVGRDMQRAGRNLSMAVTGPLVGIGALSLNVAGEFEAAMNRVAAATGASTAEMAQLDRLALDMGQTTQFAATEAATAIEMLAKNGLDASQILGGALNASMLLAASSGADLTSAGDLATDVMLNFGRTAEEMTGLVDGMTGVLLASKFGFDDYRLAIAQAGGVAGGLGVSFEDFNAAIAGTSQLFASGSDAGTAFKTFLQRLVPASGPAADAMRDLNLEFFNADGSMKSMAEIAQELQDSLSGLSDEAKNEALRTIFGTDALRTAIGLMQQGADGINELKVAIGNTSAEEQAAARMDGYQGAMRRLQSALEGLRITIARAGILEMATSFAAGMTRIVERLNEADPKILKFGVTLGTVAAAAGPVLIALGIMATAVAAIGAPVAVVVAGLAALGAAMYTFRDELRAANAAIEGFVNDSTTAIRDMASKAYQGARDVVQSIIAGLAGLYQAGVEAVGDLWRGMKDSVTGLIADAGTWGRDIAAGLSNGIRDRAASVRDSVTGLANNVKGWFTDEVEIQSPSKVFHRFGQFISEGLANGISAGGVWAQDAIGGVADGLGNALEGIVTRTVSVREAFATMLQDIASQLARSGIQSLIGGLFGGGDRLTGALRGAGLPAIPAFANGVQNFRGGLATNNERGGELVALPSGSTVIPHDLSRDMMGVEGGGTSRVEIALGPDLEGRILSQAQGQAVQITRHGIDQFSRQQLPQWVNKINRNPRDRW